LEDTWPLLEAFFKEKGLVRQHLDSYDNFIEHELQRIINEIGKIDLEIEGAEVKFGKIRVGPHGPQVREADGSTSHILPNEARLRNLSYSAPVYLEMIQLERGQQRKSVEVYIGEMPVMLKSKLCRLRNMKDEELIEANEYPLDPGGYFIVNGSERVIVTQEDLASNDILVERDERMGTEVAKVFSDRKSVV